MQGLKRIAIRESRNWVQEARLSGCLFFLDHFLENNLGTMNSSIIAFLFE
jgi:hypothetical protein